MFTGIVEELGEVRRIGEGRIEVAADVVLDGTNIGDSIAVNGVCLTVVELVEGGFCADVMPETLRRSGLGELHPGDAVDLERALPADGRFGGHIVSGHIDGTGRIVEVRPEGNARIVRIAAPPEVMALVVEKGSIAVDGISLTVARASGATFDVSLIPHTGEITVLLRKRPGDAVNLENDIVGKYVRKLVGARAGASGDGTLTLEYLQANGF